MMDDGRPGVEFVAADPPDPAPDPDTANPATGRRRVFLFAAAVLIGGALIARAATSHYDNPRSAPHPSLLASIRPSSIPAGPDIGVSSCPKATYCQSSPQVPTAVAVALHRYLPAFGAPTVTTVTRKDAASDPAGLWSRLIEAHSAAIDVLILIRGTDMPRPTPSTGLRVTPPGLASAFVRTDAAGYEVDVQWTAPDTQPPPIPALTALSKDYRLEALG